MAVITRTRNCLKNFKRDFKKGLFSQEDGKVLKVWAKEMELYGPKYIEDSSEWRDHPLYGEWFGYRASCFSIEGRIIYQIIDENTVEVCEVERITPKHDYKK
ncbi:MAG: hypothetical protein OXB88_05955 [Bacteriovoracales bacterium]|nr:hypothetical protein [Bacteriovoracales bacterium]